MTTVEAECEALGFVELNSPDGARVCVRIEDVKEVQCHAEDDMYRVLMRNGGTTLVTRECSELVAARINAATQWVKV